MPVKSCLCFFSLRGGTIFAGLLALLIALYAFEICVSAIVNMFIRIGFSFGGHLITDPVWIVILSITIYAAGFFICAIIALVGVHKNRYRLMIPFLIFLLLNVLLMVAMLTLFSFYEWFDTMFFFYTLNGVIANIYFFIVVYSYSYYVRRCACAEGLSV